MSENIHHEHLIAELTSQLEPIFSSSPQAIYLYLDDIHKICNQKFVDLLDYSSIEEWVQNPSPVSDVDQKDQQRVIDAYGQASLHLKASTLVVTINRQDGRKIKTEVIMVPLPYQGETFVLHFITQKD